MTSYEKLGGEAGVRALVREFYRLMDTLPEARQIRDMHPADLSGSEEKLYLFLSGWTGGPPLFVDKHGPPMLRRRHFPFAIDELAADRWMMCMERALRAHPGMTPEHFQELMIAFTRLAHHMRNAPPPEQLG